MYEKVSVCAGGAMHLEDGGNKTLCGLTWWFENSHGSTYCKKCQRILGLRRKRDDFERRGGVLVCTQCGWRR